MTKHETVFESGDFAEVALRIIDEFDAGDFCDAERLIAAFDRQGRTVSGQPRVRPADCSRVLLALRAVFLKNSHLFRTEEHTLSTRFNDILDAFAHSDVQHYPSVSLGLTSLRAELLLLMNQPKAVRELIGAIADRPYALEMHSDNLSDLMQIDGRARLLTGEVAGIGALFLKRALLLIYHRPFRAFRTFRELAPFLGSGTLHHEDEGRLARAVRKRARSVVFNSRSAKGPIGFARSWLAKRLSSAAGGMLLLAHSLAPARHMRGREFLVTRAMGGIGDLLMMTPGLAALAKRQGKPVKFAVQRKFFPIFEDNPHIELLDIDGAVIDVFQYRKWRNLSDCPAAKYEFWAQPFIKKGRVELFARGMGVTKRQLMKSGERVEVCLSTDQREFSNQFVAAAGFGGRPVIGVQPYSRESYRDHPDITTFIQKLSLEYDVIVFHHVTDGVPTGPGIVSTAGLSLSHSLALVAKVSVLVSVDSSFLHAASAFDVPVVAMFGPIDGRIRTLHHKRAIVLSSEHNFPCAPCWRNEDLPCGLTGKTGLSPCMAAIDFRAVQDAVARFLRPPSH